MGGIVEDLRHEWHSFARDKPGNRFESHYHRAQENRSVAKTVVRSAIGIVLIAAGVVMWFIPGPGWLFVFFGLAMFASESHLLATLLDRIEVVSRNVGRRIRRWWKKSSTSSKTLVILGAVVVAAGLGSAAVWAWLHA